jgi:hypothetical protein
MAALAANVVLAGLSSATVTHPINVALVPGDTLYVRFKLFDPSQIPANFNSIQTDFRYSGETPNGATRMDLYSNSDVSIATFNSIADFTHFGISPTFIDPTLSNPVSSFCCGRTAANLSSYLDGTGMVRLEYQAGPGVTVSTFQAAFGKSDDIISAFPALDSTILFSKNAVPPSFVPEPASVAVHSSESAPHRWYVAVAVTAVDQRWANLSTASSATICFRPTLGGRCD